MPDTNDQALIGFALRIERPPRVAGGETRSGSDRDDPAADKTPVFLEQLQADIDGTFTDETSDANGLGYMDPARWASTKEVLASQGLLKSDVPLESVFDGSFQAAVDRDASAPRHCWTRAGRLRSRRSPAPDRLTGHSRDPASRR